jgi:hypothetical protein
MKLRVDPPLTQAERSWASAAMETIYATDPSVRRPVEPVPAEKAEAVIEEAYEAMPLFGRVGVRAALATLGVAVPVVTQRRLTTIDKLTPEERLEMLETLWKGPYLLKQMTLLLKTTGALAHASTSGFQEALGYAQKAPVTPRELRS